MGDHFSFLFSRTSSVPPSASPLPCATYSQSRWPVLPPPSQPSASARSSILHSKSAPRQYTAHQSSITQHLRSSTRFKCQLDCTHSGSRPTCSNSLRSSAREGQRPRAARHFDQQSSRSTVFLRELGQVQLLKLSSPALTTPLHLQPLVREKTCARSHGHTGRATVGGVCSRSGAAEDTLDSARDSAATKRARNSKAAALQHTAPSSSLSSSHCFSLGRDDAPAAITIDTACRQRPRVVKDGGAASHALQHHHHPVDQPAQASGASPPITPIPTDSRFALDPRPSTAPRSSADSIDSTDSIDSPLSQAASQVGTGSCICGNSSSSSNLPSSPPQTGTRPPPFSTRSLMAGACIAHGSENTNGEPGVECIPVAVPANDCELALDVQKRRTLAGRDSGIALESWDVPGHRSSYTTGIELETERPTADQTDDQRHILGIDGQWDQPTRTADGRKRCQSMIYESGRKMSQDLLSFSEDELVFHMDTSACASTTASSYETGDRGRRRVSTSLGCNRGLCPRSPSLSPLPPTTGAASVPRTSFFCSPSDCERTKDSEMDRSRRQPLYHTSPSLLSSSMPNSATLLLSMPPLPSSLPESTLAHGVPFSTMLDLATAKAENITGLYFARQMNLKATSKYSLMDAAESTSVTKVPDLDVPLGAVNVDSPSSKCSTGGTSETANSIRIKVSAPSPVVRREHVLTHSSDSLHSASDCARLSCPQPATVNPNLPHLPGISNRDVATSRRCRAATSSETLVSSLLSSNITSAAADPSFKMEPGHVPDSPHAPPSAPARGQHRRSQSASHFFHLSSLKHHSPAQFNLALCYEHGQGGVERDLEKALHFYQQAADQGHTKASYNIGCICYNAGEVSKAMAWFESAGKCSVRGLRTEKVEKSSSSACDQAPQPMQCPVPKHTSLPHELEDMLLGDMAATSGPFAAYLPAILCLALLCRQGVQNREGGVILEKDREQAVELLQKLLQRTSARSHLGTRGGNSQDAAKDFAGSSRSTTHGDLRKRSSLDFRTLDFRTSSRCPSTLAHPAIVPASLSTSCPSLPLGQWNMDSEASRGSATYDPLVESLAVEDALAEGNGKHHEPSGSEPADAGSINPRFFSAEPHGPDLHESWSATLALQLLKAWTRQSSDRQGKATTTSDIGLDQKILRHHLLYITNPTHGKNLYNLGVLYDICLGERLIAARCYESAYRNSQLAADGSCRLYPALVTRINSAWNLGVLYAKHQDWSQAKSWFLKAQQDVLLHAQRQSEQDVKGAGKDQMRRDRTTTHGSLVNVFPEDKQCSLTDSPEKTRLREHGLMMSFASPFKASGPAGVDKCKRVRKKQKHCEAQDGLETDVTKVAWVLRWIDSNMKSST